MGSHAHTFFLHLPQDLANQQLTVGSSVHINDKTLATRVHTILRLKPGEPLIFFTGTQVVSTTLQQSPKPKTIVAAVVTDNIANPARKYTLCAAISLLKKEAFQAAVYSAAQMGAQTIIPVITEKSRQSFTNAREYERLISTMIAACEQSKNRYIPELLHPAPLVSVLNDCHNSDLVCFHAGGTPLLDWIPQLAHKKTSKTSVFIGPEGGFTSKEIDLFMHDSACTIAGLTPTILRSRDAACLGLGLIASTLAARD